MPSMYQQFLQTIVPIAPEIVVIGTALMVLILDFLVNKEHKYILGWFSLAGRAGRRAKPPVPVPRRGP